MRLQMFLFIKDQKKTLGQYSKSGLSQSNAFVCAFEYDVWNDTSSNKYKEKTQIKKKNKNE